MKIRTYALWTFVIVIFTCFLGCSDSNDPGINGKPKIKIGAVLPLTGKYADLGNWAKAGILTAAEELKKSDSKHSFEVIIEDAGSETKNALTAYSKLVNVDGARIIITTSSAFSLALKPKAIEDNVLFFAIASHPDITANNNGKVFRPCNTAVDEGTTISNFIKGRFAQAPEKAVLLYHNSEFGLSFNKQISSDLGPAIVASIPYDDTPDTFRTIASKVMTSNPDIIIAIGFTPSLGTLIKTVRELNYKGMIVSNVGFATPSVAQTAGEAAKGVYFVDYRLPYSSDRFKQINTLSRQSYNTDFGSISYLSFFTIKAVNYAVGQSDSTDPNKIASVLSKPERLRLDEIELTTHENGDISPELVVNEYK